MLGFGTKQDDTIIEKVLAGNGEQFGILVQRYLPTVHAIAYSRPPKSPSELAQRRRFISIFDEGMRGDPAGTVESQSHLYDSGEWTKYRFT